MKIMIKKYFVFISILSAVLVSNSLAQHQHGNDSTKTNMKKMDCCKNMEDANNKMKSEKTEMSEKNNIDLGMVDKNKDGKVYQCPMCVDQLSDDPGKCPECGMDLKKVSIEDAQKNLDKNNHQMMENCKKDTNKMDHTKMMNNDMKDVDHNKMDMKKENIVREGEIDLMAIDKNKDRKVYQDQMCWNVISDEPGECPQCGMILKEVSLSKAKENLIDHDFKVKK